MNKDLILPNTFLIGAQKSATTSIYDWLSQHPDVCAPISVKDYAFFTRNDFYEKGFDHLSSFYLKNYKGEKIILQGSVHYIYFEKALERIAKFNPNAKFILILRNPIDRAISAYEYALKFKYETLPLKEAFNKENERILKADHRELSELTYKSHGLYKKQLDVFFKYFDKRQLKILLFNDVTNNPEETMNSLFEFLKINPGNETNFRSHNVTGIVKSKSLQNAVFGKSKVKKVFIKYIVDKILPPKHKAQLRWKIIQLNTKDEERKSSNNVKLEFRKELREFFIDDIENLEGLIEKDLSEWKIVE